MMNKKGFRGKRPEPNRGTVQEFAWKELGKLPKALPRLADVSAEIRTKQQKNISLEYCS
jgi:hypothetical protein